MGTNTPHQAAVSLENKVSSWYEKCSLGLTCGPEPLRIFQGLITFLPAPGTLFYWRFQVQALCWGRQSIAQKWACILQKVPGWIGAPQSLLSAFHARNMLHSSHCSNSAKLLEGRCRKNVSPQEMGDTGIKALFKGSLLTCCSSCNFLNQFFKINVAKSDTLISCVMLWSLLELRCVSENLSLLFSSNLKPPSFCQAFSKRTFFSGII